MSRSVRDYRLSDQALIEVATQRGQEVERLRLEVAGLQRELLEAQLRVRELEAELATLGTTPASLPSAG
jgi:predicted RNase H-like nuclease (RuvC/YqgF family)